MTLAVFYPRAVVRVTATIQMSRREDRTKQVTFFVVPRAVTLERNDYNTADSVTLVFDAVRFPILPRNIRQALVEVYFGDAGSIDSEVDPIVDTAFERFIGWIDLPDMSLSEEDGSITWKARDYTALFLDVRRPPTIAIPSFNDRLDVALQRILDAIPSGKNIVLELRGLDAWPELKTAMPKGLTDAKVPTKAEDTLWHYVKRACDPVALIPQIVLDRLVVSTSRGLRDPTSQGVFVYGANLVDFHESRNLQRIREGIGLRAYAYDERKFILAQYPPAGDASVQTKAPAKHATKKKSKPKPEVDPKDKRRWFPYPNVANQAALDEAAKRIYEERSRQEFEGNFRCARMLVPDAATDFETLNDAASFDVTSLTSGDRVIIDVLPEQRAILAGLEDADARVSYLTDQGYAAEVATALAEAYAAGVQDPIEVFVKKATFSVNEDNGFDMKVDFEALLQDAG